MSSLFLHQYLRPPQSPSPVLYTLTVLHIPQYNLLPLSPPSPHFTPSLPLPIHLIQPAIQPLPPTLLPTLISLALLHCQCCSISLTLSDGCILLSMFPLSPTPPPPPNFSSRPPLLLPLRLPLHLSSPCFLLHSLPFVHSLHRLIL